MADYSRQIQTLDSWLNNNRDKQGTPEFNAVVGDLKKLVQANGPDSGGGDERLTAFGGQIAPSRAGELAGEKFRSSMDDTLNKRGKIVFDIISAQQQGERNFASAAIEVAGQGAAIMGESVWNLMSSVFSGATEEMVPDNISDPAKKFVAEGVGKMLDAAEGTGLSAALSEGVDAYQEWKKSNPNMAGVVEGALNLGLWYGPKIGVGKSGAGKSINMIDDVASTRVRPGLLTRAANQLDASIPRRTERINRGWVEDLMRPIENKRNMLDAQAKGKITAGGFFTDKKYMFDDFELGAIDDLMKTGKVSRGQTVEKVRQLGEARIGQIEDKIQAMLSPRSGAVVTRGGARRVLGARQRYDKKELMKSIDDLAESTIRSNSTLMIGKSEKSVRNAFKHARKLVRDADNTPKGILQARRDFDKWMKAQYSENALYNPDTLDTVRSISNRVIRDRMDEQLQGLVPDIKPLLLRQSGLFKAVNPTGVLAQKAAIEPTSAIRRQWAKLSEIIGLRSEFNNTMAALTGHGGLASAALFAPIYTAALGGALTKYAGGKLLFSKQSKQIFSTLLRGTDDAIKIVRQSPRPQKEIVNLIDDLKADRAVIMQFLNEGLFEK